jgi:hypothetical protein
LHLPSPPKKDDQSHHPQRNRDVGELQPGGHFSHFSECSCCSSRYTLAVQTIKTALTVIAAPFIYALAFLALIGVLLFSKEARAKWLSNRRHVED